MRRVNRCHATASKMVAIKSIPAVQHAHTKIRLWAGVNVAVSGRAFGCSSSCTPRKRALPLPSWPPVEPSAYEHFSTPIRCFLRDAASLALEFSPLFTACYGDAMLWHTSCKLHERRRNNRHAALCACIPFDRPRGRPFGFRWNRCFVRLDRENSVLPVHPRVPGESGHERLATGLTAFPFVIRGLGASASRPHFYVRRGTNFKAVCSAEKPTTLISTIPMARPAAMTSFSVIVLTLFG